MNAENRIFLIITLIAVLVIALGINYYIYRRQVAAEQRRLKIKKLQKTLPEVLETLSVLKQTSCNTAIQSTLENYASSLFGQLIQLAPDPEVQQKLQHQQANPPEPMSPTSAQGLKQIQQATNKSLTVIKLLHGKTAITDQQLEDMTIELSNVRQLAEAEVLLVMSDSLLMQKKTAAANNYLKQAKNFISKLSEGDDRKTAKLSEITEKMEALKPKPAAHPIDNEPR